MKKRKQYIRRCIFFLVIGIVAILVMCNLPAKAEPEIVPYDVVQNDTLWDIASACKPNDMTYNEYITYLYKLNDGLSADIYPGDRIWIVVYDEE